MTLPRTILWIIAFGFAAFGMAFTLWPETMALYVDIQLPTATARTDLAATYGGLELGVACFLMVCASREEWLTPGLWASAMTTGGFAIVRAIGLAFAPYRLENVIFYALALEVVATAAAIWAARQAGAWYRQRQEQLEQERMAYARREAMERLGRTV